MESLDGEKVGGLAAYGDIRKNDEVENMFNYMFNTSTERQGGSCHVNSYDNIVTVLLLHGSAKNTDLETVPARKNTGPVTCLGVFVSRLSTSVKATQVRKYIKRHTGLSVKIERLKTKYNNYSSFFIPVTEPDRSKLLNPEVWPTQCIVKKYCRYN